MPVTDVRLYTPAQASAVSGLNPKAVQNAIDKRVVQPVVTGAGRPKSPTATGQRIGRLLTVEDLVRLRLYHGVPADRRSRVFKEMAARPSARTVDAGDFLLVDVSAARRQVAERVRQLEVAERAIHRDKAILGGEPVFKGSRIPVYGLMAMLDAGADPSEILEGYPKLDSNDLELARIWVAAHPRRGRPKPLTSLGLSPKASDRVTLKADPFTRRPPNEPKG